MIKIKFKKGNMAMILAFMLMLSLFFACTIAFMYNNKVQERRGSFIDYINKQAMYAQAELEGYSEEEQYCFIIENGVRLDRSAVNAKIAKVKKQVEDNIKLAFPSTEKSIDGIPNMSAIFTLQDIEINIFEKDKDKRDGTAYVEIIVKYSSSLRAPFANSEQQEDGTIKFEDKTNTGGRFKVTYKDNAKRAIENPRRYKGVTLNPKQP